MNDLFFWISLGLGSALVALFLIGIAYKVGYREAEKEWIVNRSREENAVRWKERQDFERRAIDYRVGEYHKTSGVFQFRKPADIAMDFIERACEEKE